MIAMKKSSKQGHSFPTDFGFTGSCGPTGGSRYVAGYFRGGPVKKHEDEAEDRKLIKQEVGRLLKKK